MRLHPEIKANCLCNTSILSNGWAGDVKRNTYCERRIYAIPYLIAAEAKKSEKIIFIVSEEIKIMTEKKYQYTPSSERQWFLEKNARTIERWNL